MPANAFPFDPVRFLRGRMAGHGGRMGIEYRSSGEDWAELALPYSNDLIGDPDSGVLASGPILAMMDMATSVSVWSKVKFFVPHATLDLRVDYLRPATP